MERLGIIVTIVIAYIIGATLVGVFSARKQQDSATFMTAKNQMGPILVGVLIMSEFIGTAATLGTAQRAYEVGISAAWNLITVGCGFFMYAFFMAPKYNASGEYTISGALAKTYGPTLRTMVSLTMIYALITINVTMYTGGAATISKLIDISIENSVFVVAAITIICVVTGGMKGVGLSNIIHASFKYASLFAAAWAAWYFFGQHPEAVQAIPPQHYDLMGIGVSTFVAWTVANIGAVFSTQYIIQCISTVRTPGEAKIAAIIAGALIVPMGFLTAYIGTSSRAIFPNIKSVMAMPAFLDTMPAWLAGVTVCGILASSFVTILACILGASALFMKDLIVPIFNPAEEKRLSITRVVTFVVGLLPIPFALYVPGLLKTIFFARALRTSVAVLAVCMFYAPLFGSPRSASIGLGFSVVMTSVWFALGNPYGIDNIYVAAVSPALVMLIDHLFFKKKDAPATSSSE